MKAFYINLDSSSARRIRLEKSFAACEHRNWKLQRYAAKPARECAGMVGRISDAEKACALTHTSLIDSQKNNPAPFLVLEDDACFGRSSLTILDGLISAPGDDEWDILFTDLGIGHAATMIDLVYLRKELEPQGRVTTIDVRNFPVWFGATSYVVNARSVDKIVGHLAAASFDLPYDLLLRRLVGEQKIRALVSFPFLTTVSRDADQSAIQPKSRSRTSLLLDSFRRMIWIEGDAYDPTADLDVVRSDIGARSKHYGLLWAAMVDNSFEWI